MQDFGIWIDGTMCKWYCSVFFAQSADPLSDGRHNL